MVLLPPIRCGVALRPRGEPSTAAATASTFDAYAASSALSSAAAPAARPSVASLSVPESPRLPLVVPMGSFTHFDFAATDVRALSADASASTGWGKGSFAVELRPTVVRLRRLSLDPDDADMDCLDRSFAAGSSAASSEASIAWSGPRLVRGLLQPQPPAEPVATSPAALSAAASGIEASATVGASHESGDGFSDVDLTKVAGARGGSAALGGERNGGGGRSSEVPSDSLADGDEGSEEGTVPDLLEINPAGRQHACSLASDAALASASANGQGRSLGGKQGDGPKSNNAAAVAEALVLSFSGAVAFLEPGTYAVGLECRYVPQAQAGVLRSFRGPLRGDPSAAVVVSSRPLYFVVS